jgi:hypothetical protein
MLTANTFAQQKTWTTPPKKWNMTLTTPTSSSLSGGASTYSVANGAYDEAGNLLFYVQDNYIMGPTGSGVGELPNYNGCDGYTVLNAQIAIVPIPGTCREFYVIYSKDNPTGTSPLLYVKVDCSGSTPTVIYNGTFWAAPPCWQVNQAFLIENHFGSDITAFAVSKVYTGSGSTAKRFLLSVSLSGIVRSEISSTGISSGSVTASPSLLGLTYASDFAGIEAEISWGSNKFAWSSNNGTVHIISLNSNGSGEYVGTPALQSYTISGAKGIEFNNSTGTTPYLYVAAASDLKRINTSNQTYSSFSWGSGNDLSKTFLEYGKNNRIYGVSPIYSGGTLTGSKLIPIASTSVLTGITADIDSRYVVNNHLVGIFTLPNQIDGEDYTYFNGTPKVTVTNFTLNSNVVSDVCENGADKYCQNDAITFGAAYSNGGTPDQYNLMIQAYDAGLCSPTQLTGSGYINYQSGWVSGELSNVDLRSLTSGGLNLGNITGTVKITYSIKDKCGNQSSYARFIQIYDPVPLSIDLGIYQHPSTWTTPSHSIGSPVNVGTYSLSYRVDNSTGTLSQLTVLIEKVDNGGSFIQTIYNKTINTTNPTLYDNVGLNSLCVGSFTCSGGSTPCTGGYTSYFACDNGANSYQNYYKITVTLSNLCGTSSDWSYFYVGAYSMPVNPNVTERKQQEVLELENNSFNVFPNPVTNQLTIEFNQPTDDAIEISLTDVLGKQTRVLMPSTTIKKGNFNQTFDVSILPAGLYSYQIKTSNTIQTGMISKN